MPADWQLPDGVSRGLWEYVHDPRIAQDYDAKLADAPLFHFDLAFVRQHCPTPCDFVDLGCGTGRLSVYLAQLGYRLLAVDLSEDMLREVQAKARHAQVTIPCLKANLVELGGIDDQSFDAAGCLFQTLGMIVGAEARQRVLEHAYRILRPGGTFVLHVHNRGFHLGTSAGRRQLALNAWRWLVGREALGDFMMPPHQGIGPMPMHVFSRGEIVKCMTRAGFSIVEIRPVGVAGNLTKPWFLQKFRAYGFMIAAKKPGSRR